MPPKLGSLGNGVLKWRAEGFRSSSNKSQRYGGIKQEPSILHARYSYTNFNNTTPKRYIQEYLSKRLYSMHTNK